MNKSLLRARWSVLLALLVSVVLLVAGCSSPTGSTVGGGAGTGTITIAGGEDAQDFDGSYTVSSVVFFRDDPDEEDSVTIDRVSDPIGEFYVAFCLEPTESGPEQVLWERMKDASEYYAGLTAVIDGTPSIELGFDSKIDSGSVVTASFEFTESALTLDLVNVISHPYKNGNKLDGSEVTFTIKINQITINFPPDDDSDPYCQ